MLLVCIWDILTGLIIRLGCGSQYICEVGIVHTFFSTVVHWELFTTSNTFPSFLIFFSNSHYYYLHFKVYQTAGYSQIPLLSARIVDMCHHSCIMDFVCRSALGFLFGATRLFVFLLITAFF